MSEAKHTPGPWQAGRPDMATIVDGVDSKWIYAGEQYVAVASGRIDGEWDEVMSNARLIAAAPDLLAALNRCQDYLGGPWCAPEDVIEQVRAAVAKAEGRE